MLDTGYWKDKGERPKDKEKGLEGLEAWRLEGFSIPAFRLASLPASKLPSIIASVLWHLIGELHHGIF